jgi:hypothetical protein
VIIVSGPMECGTAQHRRVPTGEPSEKLDCSSFLFDPQPVVLITPSRLRSEFTHLAHRPLEEIPTCQVRDRRD